MISVIISTYKREPPLLERAINSVLCQTYKDIEIIIVDDSPADYAYREEVASTVYAYKRTNPHINIHYIQHEKNRGACVARNTGLAQAQGEFVAYLDDDDEWLPDKLEKQIQIFSSSAVALVYCGRICKNDLTGKSNIESIQFYKGDVFKQLLYSNFIGSTSFPLIKANCLKEIGGFDEQMQSAQDVDVWLRIAKNHPIDYVSEPLVIYHEHDGEQITSNPQKKICGLERLNEKYKQFIEDDDNLWHRRHIFLTPFYAMAGNKKTAFHIWWACVHKCPGKIPDNLKYLRLILKGKKKNPDGKKQDKKS